MNKMHLNHNWNYVPSYKEEYIKEFPKSETVHIPHTNKELPFNNFSEKDYQFISSYEKVVDMKKVENKRYILRFEAVMTYAEVYVNETLVISHKGGYTPFQVDVTNELKDGINKVFVMVDSTERKDIPPFGFVIDYLCYGGIYREVSLTEYDANFVDQVFVHNTNEDLVFRTFLDVTKKEPSTLTYIIKDNDQVIHQITHQTDLTETDFTIKENIQLEKWTLENPKLYTLEVLLNGVVNVSTRFGYRQVKMTTQGFFLNDELIKLYGVNRHQSFPYVGYAMPKNAQRKDADILKYDLGVNVVRSSHYPPSKHFLDRCDEIGLLVFNEIPGWQHIGDEHWQQVAIENTREMVYRDYNHPSIFIWGTRINESPDNDEFYQSTNDMAKSLDLSRPTGGVRNFKGSNLIEDVYTYNDFVHRGNNEGIEPAKKVAKVTAPHLVTEFNGHMYPTKKFDDEFHRVNQAKRHLNVQNDSFKHDNVSGAIGWCMFDYNTHKDFGSGDRICYHGIMDMFRIPKYASGVYASQSDRKPYAKILGNLSVGEHEASEIKELIVLTNADSIKFYINKDYIGEFHPHDRWGHLPHPPVIIDDFIGNLIHDNEDFTDRDSDTVKEVLLHIMKHGMKLPLRLTIKMGLFLRKYKMSIDQAAKLYENYVGKWGQESITYRFELIKDGSVVKEEIVGATYGSDILVTQDDLELTEEHTYETTRIVLEHVNLNGNPLAYSNEIIQVKTEGPIELIGPNLITLTGGSTGLWVKTIGKKGTAKVIFETQHFGTKEVSININEKN